MKTVGIVGGIAPESTIQYYRLIISAYRERRKDGTYPSILINSIDMKRMLDLIGANDLIGGIEGLVLGGTELPLLLSDTGGRALPFLDTTKIHAEWAVAKMLS